MGTARMHHKAQTAHESMARLVDRGAQRLHHGPTPQTTRRLCILAIAVASVGLWPVAANAAGKRHAEAGAKLTAAINKTLLEQVFCHSARACHDLLPVTLETDSEIVVSFFAVGVRNEAAFLAAVTLALKDGVRVTEGLPITMHGFRETEERHRRSGLFIKDVKPFVTIELK